MNPELQRNLWLELTPARLGFIAIAVALSYGVLSMLPEGVNETVTTVVLLVVLGLWGSRRAADAVPGEVEGRTWDTQRLSAIDPWSMCWGKLAGATSLAWCSAALVLLGYAAIGGRDWPELAKTVAGCALVQVAAFFASLLLLRAGGRRMRGHTTLAQLIGFISPSGVVSFNHPAGWYGLQFEPALAQALGFGLLALLALFGAWRAMRVELQYRNLPWGLALGLLALFAIQAGYPYEHLRIAGRAPDNLISALLEGGDVPLGAAAVILALIVTTLLAPKDPVAIRSWVAALRARRTRHAFEYQPVWITAFAVALVVTVVGMIVGGSEARLLLPSMLLLALRDSALVLAFTLGVQFARGHLGVLVVLGILHLVVPTLLANLIGPSVYAAFWPQPNSLPVALVAQAVAAIALAVWRLRVTGALPAGVGRVAAQSA